MTGQKNEKIFSMKFYKVNNELLQAIGDANDRYIVGSILIFVH